MARNFTYQPLNTPKPLGPDLWMIDGPRIDMAAGVFKIPFPTRMIVARLPGGGLWVHSPIALSDDLRAVIDGLGAPRVLIAPNKIHYAAVQDWLEAYPGAQSWGVPGIGARAKANGIAVTIQHRLGDTPPPDWADTLDQTVIRGSRFMEEAVFFHRATGTLILTDLIENFAPARLGWAMRIMTRLAGNLGPHGRAPLDLRLTFAGRKALARPGLERMLGWPVRQITMAHGDPIFTDAPARLRAAFDWLR